MSRAGHAETAMRAAPNVRDQSPLDVALLKIVDGGLAGCIFVVPLLMGGRQGLGQLVLAALAVGVALAWMLRQCQRRASFWRYSSAEWLLAAGVVLLLVQTLSLSPSTLAWVAPRTGEILPLWTETAPTAAAESSTSLGIWSCVSLTPHETKAGLTIFLSYCLLFLVTVQRIRTLEDVERLLRWVALSAVLMAVFGLVQLLTSNGKFFWYYEHPFSRTSDGAKGSFTNRNHFAHFLALGIGPLIWWLQDGLGRRAQRRKHQRRRVVAGTQAAAFQTEANLSGLRTLAFGLVMFAGLMSLSRGGAVVILVATGISVAVCYRARRLKTRFVLSLSGVAVLIGALLAVHGFQQVSDRMEQLSSGSVEKLDAGSARRMIWSAVCKGTTDFALLGSGVGSHRHVYPMYLDHPPEAEFTHAENGPLQVLLETGAVGLTLVVAGIGLCAFWCLGGLRRAESSRVLVCAGAISASLAVSVVHSLADFVWYVPACMAMIAVLAACSCRVWQLAGAEVGKQVRRKSLPKPIALAMLAVLVATGVWMIGNRVGPTMAESHWDHYRILKLAADNPTAAEREQQAAASPDEIYETSLEAVNRMIDELEQVVRLDPHNARAHLALVATYLKRFDHTQQRAENAMALSDLRDAAAQAYRAAEDDQQRQEVEQWLARTLGEKGDDLHAALRHTRRGLELCPLQGEGYLFLAELRFLERPDGETVRDAYIDQALLVRPFEGNVLFEAGRAAIDQAVLKLHAAGESPLTPEATASFQQEFERGLAYWRWSFRGGPTHQKRLIEALAGRIPVAYFIESFQPDLEAVRMTAAAYRWLAMPEQSSLVSQLYGDRCRAEGQPVEDAEAVAAWLESELAQIHFIYAQLAHDEAGKLQGEEAARTWLEAAWYHHVTHDWQQALQCAKNAYRCAPDNYEVRYTLALRLIEDKQFEDAEDHLHWCSRKRPDDDDLRWLLEETTKNRINQQVNVAYGKKSPHPTVADGGPSKEQRTSRGNGFEYRR